MIENQAPVSDASIEPNSTPLVTNDDIIGESPSAQIQATENTSTNQALFFLASKRCQAEVNKLSKKHSMKGDFFINAGDSLNRRLLMIAVKDKHEQGLQTLIRLGVDVEQPGIGLDALDIALAAIFEGHDDYFFVQHLLKANKRIEDSHRQLLLDLLIMYPEPTQRVIDKYGFNFYLGGRLAAVLSYV